jgi:uncharacterized membrane protein
MAQRTITLLVDDLDDTPIADGAGETVTFGLDGKDYEIDLTNENAAALREAISRYTSAARTVSGRSTRSPRRTSPSASEAPANDDYSPAAVREWAKANKIEVSARGRIPQDVVAQFRSAGN